MRTHTSIHQSITTSQWSPPEAARVPMGIVVLWRSKRKIEQRQQEAKAKSVRLTCAECNLQSMGRFWMLGRVVPLWRKLLTALPRIRGSDDLATSCSIGFFSNFSFVLGNYITPVGSPIVRPAALHSSRNAWKKKNKLKGAKSGLQVELRKSVASKLESTMMTTTATCASRLDVFAYVEN